MAAGAVAQSPDPAIGWKLSGAMDWHDCDDWDLWQVRLADQDDVPS